MSFLAWVARSALSSEHAGVRAVAEAFGYSAEQNTAKICGTSETGFHHGRLHGFRHFFCSQAFADGASEPDIKDWLGHRNSKMVAHYRHFGDEDSRRKMQQIDFLGRDDRTS